MNTEPTISITDEIIAKAKKAFPNHTVLMGYVMNDNRYTMLLNPNVHVPSGNVDSLTGRDISLGTIKFDALSLEELTQQVYYLINLFKDVEY